MADIIDYKVFGDDMQMVEIELDTGEAVRGETGCKQRHAGMPMRPGAQVVLAGICLATYSADGRAC